MTTAAATKLVYDFAEGSQGHARPARRQGRQRGGDDPRAGRRPGAGGLHDHDRGVRRVHEVRRPGVPGRPRGGGREGARPPRGAGGEEARRLRRPAARLGPQRRARVDAGHARHGPQPRLERRVGRGPRPHDRQRALRVGLISPLRADVRKRLPGDQGRALRGADRGEQARARGGGRRRARRGRAEGADRPLQGGLRGGDGRGLPAGSAGAAAPGDRRRVRLVDGRARGQLPALQPHPRRVGHGRQRAADGVRQPRRRVVLGRRVLARRGDRRAQAVGGLPAQRAGRGRGVRSAHAARPSRDEGLDARTRTRS